MYKDVTKLTADWLKNNEDYDLPGSSAYREAKCRDYYLAVCSYIRDNHFLKLTPEQIEVYIADGEVEVVHVDGSVEHLSCRIKNAEEREYLFLSAQAKQLIYDCISGRASMLRGEDLRYNVCWDAIDRLKMLGLYQRTRYTV